MKVKDPNSFAQKYDIDLIMFFRKWTTYFYLSEELKYVAYFPF